MEKPTTENRNIKGKRVNKMKYYYIKNQKGKVEIQTRKKGITLTRIKRLEEQGKEIFKIVEIDDNFLEYIKNNPWQMQTRMV